MSASCGHDHVFDGTSSAYRRALVAVIVINAAMFLVEMTFGFVARSQALKADALDFLADSVTYGLSLYMIGKPLSWRAGAALAKGLSLAAMGVYVLGSTAYEVLVVGVPQAEIMGGIAVLALIANLASIVILMRWRDGDANVRSVWLCSRNDAIGNVAVLGAALLVGATASGWPDLAVAAAMAGLFLWSAVQIVQRALAELKVARGEGMSPGEGGGHGGGLADACCAPARDHAHEHRHHGAPAHPH